MGQIINSRQQAPQGQPVTKLETTADYPSWECELDKRDFHDNKFKLVISNKVRGQKHHCDIIYYVLND